MYVHVSIYVCVHTHTYLNMHWLSLETNIYQMQIFFLKEEELVSKEKIYEEDLSSLFMLLFL